jgi:hypothetical protein
MRFYRYFRDTDRWPNEGLSKKCSMINYNGKVFRSLSNSENGGVSLDTVFRYVQVGNLVTCSYSGGKIVWGHLIALVHPNGCLDMRYHQLNTEGALMTGTCFTKPEILAGGRLRLHEKWRWTSGDCSEGTSVLQEEEGVDSLQSH